MPVQRQGSESLSFQSEKAEEEEDWSTADLRESRARPSGEREREGEELMMLGSRTNQRGTERNRISSSLGTAPVPHVAAEPNPVSLTRAELDQILYSLNLGMPPNLSRKKLRWIINLSHLFTKFGRGWCHVKWVKAPNATLIKARL
ncbi:hypothetical protein YC2023_079574 [Brassica napus]